MASKKNNVLGPLDGKTLKIGAHELSVSVRKELWTLPKSHVDSATELGKKPHAFGYFDPSTLEIALSSELADSIALETLLHEILHVLVEMTGCRESLKLGREENVVQALGNGLAGALIDNSNLMTIINKIVRKKRERKK